MNLRTTQFSTIAGTFPFHFFSRSPPERMRFTQFLAKIRGVNLNIHIWRRALLLLPKGGEGRGEEAVLSSGLWTVRTATNALEHSCLHFLRILCILAAIPPKQLSCPHRKRINSLYAPFHPDLVPLHRCHRTYCR